MGQDDTKPSSPEQAATRRFPSKARLIAKLVSFDESFCELCEDLAEVERALAETERFPKALQAGRRDECREWIEILTEEIASALGMSKVVPVERRTNGSLPDIVETRMKQPHSREGDLGPRTVRRPLGLADAPNRVPRADRESWLVCLQTLSALRYPAIAIDRRGRVLDVNNFMDVVLEDDIRINDERLWIGDPQARTHYEDWIVGLAANADSPQSFATNAILSARIDGRPPVIINLIPLHAPGQIPQLGASAILTFNSLAARPAPAPSLLIKAFGLTPAEARLAATLANGSSLEGAAERLGISADTARHQLKSVFLKTDTHRQSQLVAHLVRI